MFKSVSRDTFFHFVNVVAEFYAKKTDLQKFVEIEPQTLTDEQKSQARENIGAEKVLTSETWTFTLDDDSTVTKEVCVK